MLSVLIPTYNYNAVSLVKELHQQLVAASIEFEIICLDDGSQSELNFKNEKINSFSFSSFKSLEVNRGRSGIRNLLAKKAKYNWLLFLDADVMPVNTSFISNYMACFNKDKTVFCGGLLYENKQENKHLLRYKYGKKHEEISVNVRRKHPEKYFFTSNFLIKKDVFNAIQFHDKLVNYGYEDLVFSKQLLKQKNEIYHLQNEVYHLGLDSNQAFVLKSSSAIKNLFFLLQSKQLDYKDTSISNLYLKMKYIRFILLPISVQGIASKKSSLFFLNVHRLLTLHQTFKNFK